MKDNYNRMYKLIIFNEDARIITTCDFAFFKAFYQTIDRLVNHDCTYEYKDEFIDSEELCLYISIQKKKKC